MSWLCSKLMQRLYFWYFMQEHIAMQGIHFPSQQKWLNGWFKACKIERILLLVLVWETEIETSAKHRTYTFPLPLYKKILAESIVSTYDCNACNFSKQNWQTEYEANQFSMLRQCSLKQENHNWCFCLFLSKFVLPLSSFFHSAYARPSLKINPFKNILKSFTF